MTQPSCNPICLLPATCRRSLLCSGWYHACAHSVHFSCLFPGLQSVALWPALTLYDACDDHATIHTPAAPRDWLYMTSKHFTSDLHPSCKRIPHGHAPTLPYIQSHQHALNLFSPALTPLHRWSHLLHNGINTMQLTPATAQPSHTTSQHMHASTVKSVPSCLAGVPDMIAKQPAAVCMGNGSPSEFTGADRAKRRLHINGCGMSP